jgi:alpha-beta hydrolase superfamily lysophospholipase
MRLAAIVLLVCGSATAEVRRQDFQVPGDPGISLFVRHVTAGRGTAVPVLLLHGARVPGVASFDLPVAGGSLAADLAAAGHDVYIMDARGYGASTRMPEMDREPRGSALARSSDVVRDIAAVIEWLRARHQGTKPAILGWATGGHWAGHYASIYSDRLSGVILLNTLYGGAPDHPTLGRGSDLEDPARPGAFNAAAMGAYRLSAASSLLGVWDRSIPGDDKAAWRDPAIAAAYVSAALASDPTSSTRTPPSFRAPSGAMEDSFYLATGRQLWDASLIGCPILALRSERDFWSRPEDLIALERHAMSALIRTVTLPGATHFVHLDRPERGRAQLLRELLAFLAQRTAAPSK